MSFYLYILECQDKSYYIGHTDNLEKRLAEHKAGLSCHTSKRLPITLACLEEFQTREEAFFAERKLKGWSRRKKQAYIAKNYSALIEFSKNYT